MKRISLIIILILLGHILLPVHVLACDEPDITVIPESIDFGVVNVGSSSTEEVIIIRNDGDADLCIYSVTMTGTDAAHFTITHNVATNLILPPGTPATVSVQFQPQTDGVKSASLLVDSDDVDECNFYVSLSGTGALPIYADLEIIKSDNPDPVVTGSTIAYTVNVVNNGPDVATGVTVIDTLPESVVFQSATPSTGIAEYLSGDITWTIGSIASGDSADIVIEVTAPSELGIITNHVAVSGNEDDPILSNNEAIEDTEVIVDTNIAPDINVSPLSVNFGSLEVGTTSAPATIMVTNTGNAELVIGTVIIDNARFAIAGAGIAGYTLMPGDSVYIILIFQPAWNGHHSSTLSIFSNDPDENPVVITLSGYGIVIQPTPTPLPPKTLPVSLKYFIVDFLGKITKVPASTDGRPLENVVAFSPDNVHLLEIDKGTGAFDKDGNPVTYITVRRIMAPQLPENRILVGEAYNFKPSGTIFDRDVRLTLGYHVEDLPDEFISIATAYYDSHLGWKYLNSKGNQVAQVSALTAAVNHFTVFAILAQVPAQLPIINEIETEISPPQLPASFVLGDLAITTSESKYGETLTFVARYGENATITLDVINKGGASGVYRAILRLNGKEKDSLEFSLGVGETRHITFNTTGNYPGKYIVQVGELYGEFKSELWINWWMITGFALVTILLSWLAFFLIRRYIRKTNQEG